MHDIAGFSITVATILAATFFSNQSLNNLRSEMMGKLDSIQKGMRGSTLNKHATTYASPTLNSNRNDSGMYSH